MLQRRIVVLLLTLLLAIPVLVGRAQSPAVLGIPAEDALVGLQAGVWRTYRPVETRHGGSTAYEATPIAALGMSHIRSIAVEVREFDTAEHAAVAFEQVSAGYEAYLSYRGTQSGAWAGITGEDLSGIGTQANLVRADYTGGGNAWVEYVTVQRDQYVFVVSVEGRAVPGAPGWEDIDTSLPTVDIATAISTNGEPSPDEPVLVEDGTSTGGLWRFMLLAGDPLLMGLVPRSDGILYPYPVTAAWSRAAPTPPASTQLQFETGAAETRSPRSGAPQLESRGAAGGWSSNDIPTSGAPPPHDPPSAGVRNR